MPILNPRQAYNLIGYKGNDIDILRPFIASLLPIASEKINFNYKMMEIHRKFTDFIIFNIDHFTKFFGLPSEDFGIIENIISNNAYKSINDIIQSNSKQSFTTTQKYDSIKMDYIGCLDNLIKIKINVPHNQSFFFIPYFNTKIGWFISDQSYAILKYTGNYDENNLDEEDFKMKLTAFLLVASGYTLVSCVFTPMSNLFLFSDFLQTNYFLETHIFSEIDICKLLSYDYNFYNKPDIGFFYLYLHKKVSFLSNELKKILSINSKNFKIFYFSKEFSFNQDTHPILYDRFIIQQNSPFTPALKDLSGFKNDYFMITLCNVPLYSSSKRNKDWTPIKLSGYGYGKVLINDFSSLVNYRVQVIIDNDVYYVEYPDLHFMNLELFITDPMYLSSSNINTDMVEQINATYKNKTTNFEKQKAKKTNIDKNMEAKLHTTFHYLYKYSFNENKNIEPYTSQIYAVCEAISFLATNKDKKGIILQVHTGEGKSYIIQALAQYLARQGNTVHIATSNIILASRDFENAYNYYCNCERKFSIIGGKMKKPSILIHQYELENISHMINDRKIIDQKEYDSFYDEKNFNNQTNMNISVCMNQSDIQSNIVYSTFLNFEAFYLTQYERNPGFISNYMSNCYLIIDEADSILIDELVNGTILSKEMKSNAIEVLDYVYYFYTRGIQDASKVYNLVIDKFPECVDLTIDDIEQMFREIDKVKSNDFSLGNKYIIASKPGEKEKKRIIPFDSEHKGIAEFNKNFCGFIHQFIGIKEKKANMTNLEINPLTMNYNFISHPTYIKKYKGVCGVTGTIGDNYDKELLKDYYGIITKEVPRHQMNLRYDLPIILCENIKERNKRICKEIKQFHINNYPVLAVFIDINEIETIKQLLIKNCNIKESEIISFDVINNENEESIKNELEKRAGLPGAITLGTNFCGRGVNINCEQKQLCVIVSYYNEDERSINQVIGRAGRNGNSGMTRIICTKEKRFKSKDLEKKNNTSFILNEFDVKNSFQIDFIKKVSDRCGWIFDETEYDIPILKDTACQLRESHININRITAFNCKFPICMSVNTFLILQKQRIYSLKNCPECKYTWNLFKIYMRETVLESWSLFVDSVDCNFKKMKKQNYQFHENDYSIYSKDENTMYAKFFKNEYELFLKLFRSHIPYNKAIGKDSIQSLFLLIHHSVAKEWKHQVMMNIPKSIRTKCLVKAKDDSYTSFKIGFFPMSLAENSGARLTPLTPEQQNISDKGRLYIIDPELRYIKKGTDKRFSITVFIDKIFEKFQAVVDDKLQGLFGIRFFLRRTLAGCEFGVCVDPMYECNTKFTNCLIDLNPIIMLTICTKSSTFWIGGILMILLVFVTTLCIAIGKWFINPSKMKDDILNLVKLGLKKFFGKKNNNDDNNNSSDLISTILNPICDLVIKSLQKKIIKNTKNLDEGLSVIFETLLNLFVPMETTKLDEKLSEKISDNVFSKLNLDKNSLKYINGTSPFGKLIKIGVLIILLIALFVMNFKHRKQLDFQKSTTKNASSYLNEDKKNKSVDISNYDSYKNAKNEVNDEINEIKNFPEAE